MKIYCMSDIHGFVDEFKENLSIIADNLKREDSKLVLLGDYIHGGNGDYEVCNAIIRLQENMVQIKLLLC
ncbi:MAG: metallophosphoesterase [bacterium]|nr:metallophosphoesterase [bacterium]